MLVYGECECFVMQMLYVCVLCASCSSSQCCVLHDLQFVNAGRGCNWRPYRRGILQSRSHNCFIGSHECLLLFTPSQRTTNSRCHQQLGPHNTKHKHPNQSAKHHTTTNIITRHHHGVKHTLQPDIVDNSTRTIIRPLTHNYHN